MTIILSMSMSMAESVCLSVCKQRLKREGVRQLTALSGIASYASEEGTSVAVTIPERIFHKNHFQTSLSSDDFV